MLFEMCSSEGKLQEILQDFQHIIDQAEEGFLSIDDIKESTKKLEAVISNE